MMNGALIISTAVLLFGCNQGRYEKADPNEVLGKTDTVAIYLNPLQFDTIRASIKDRFSFSGDDTLKYIPSEIDIKLEFEFSGKMKEYMEHGKMIVTPYDSSVIVKRIDNKSFIVRVNKPIDDWKISMFYDFALDEPYHFSFIRDSITYYKAPKESVRLIMRSEMTKPGTPWEYY